MFNYPTLALRILVSVTSASLVVAGVPGVAHLAASSPRAPESRPGQSQTAAVTADSALTILAAAEKDIARDTFDPQAIVTAVGKDRTALLTWVRDHTYWVPYRGALRGPTGVLMDRLGNSVDRSLLLAELLRLAGHTVRLAQGTIADPPAREALRLMRPVPANPRPPAVENEAAFLRYAKQLGYDPEVLRAMARSESKDTAIQADLSKRIAAQVPFLVGEIGPRTPAAAPANGALAAVSDHWWVQVRDATSWIDLDPMWPASRAAAGQIQAARTFAFDRPAGEIPLPSEFTQEMTVRVVIEQWKDGKLAEKTPLAHTFRPAEAFGQPITLQISPLGWPNLAQILKDPDPVRALKTILLKQTEWLPSFLIGERAFRQSSFVEDGELNAKAGQPPAAARVAGGAADAFGGDAGPEAQLTAAWIEYEVRVPGRPANKARRDLFDLLSSQRRLAKTVADPAPDASMRAARALGLATAVQLLPLTSRLSPEYVSSQAVLGLVANRDAQADIAKRTAAGDFSGAIDRAHAMKPVLNGHLLELALTRFEWSATRQDVYVDAPTILSFRTALFQNASGELGARQGFDVVTNAVAIRPGATGDPFAIRVSQGMSDTNLEDLLMRGATRGNAGALLAASAAQGSWVIVRSPADPGWPGMALPSDVRARIEADLQQGYVVLAPRPATVAAAGGQIAWWRIDPKTGDTLGMGRQGWGQALAEYAAYAAAAFVVIFDICAIISFNGAPSSQMGRRIGQCACFAFGGALAGLTSALGGVAVVLLKVLPACIAMSFMQPQPAELGEQAAARLPDAPALLCGAGVQARASPG